MFFCLLLLWFQTLSAPAHEHAKRGFELSQQGELKSAEAELRQAILLAPNDAGALALLGVVLGKQQKPEEADVYLERALKIDPGDLGARYTLAVNQFGLGQTLQAKANVERILKATPDTKPAVLLLGTVLEKLKDYGRAAGLLESVLELARQQPAWIATLARCYYHINRQEKARTALEWLRPAGPEAVFLGGETAAQCGDLETAERLLTSIQFTYPDKTRLGYELAMVQYNAKHFAESQSTLQQLIARGTREPKIFNLQSWCYHRLNRLTDAMAAMQRAIELAPVAEINYDHLAQILLEAGRYTDAYVAVKKALDVAPNSALAYKLTGHVETRLGLFKQALESYARAVKLDASDPDSLLGLAAVQQKLFQHAEATATFEKGIARFPRNPQLYEAYGRMLLEPGMGRDAAVESRAVSVLEKALALDKSLPEAHYELGKFLMGRDKVSEALPHLEAAANLEPKSSKIHLTLATAYRRMGRSENAAEELQLFKKLEAQETPGR